MCMRRWAIEAGQLVERRGAEEVRSDVPAPAGPRSAARGAAAPAVTVELAGAAEVTDSLVDPLARELIVGMSHAAFPVVECDEHGAVGAVVLPAGEARSAAARRFGFVLTAGCLRLADDDGVCEPLLARLAEERQPVDSAASALAALLRLLLRDHPETLSRVRDDLERMEERILEGRERIDRAKMVADSRRLLGLDTFYQGLSDMASELADDALAPLAGTGGQRAFRSLVRQLDRLSTRLEALQDYSLQVNSLYQESIDVRQNNVMQWLTVVATIAMPLTFITSWYGMNFPNMLLINTPWGYGVAAVSCLAIAVAEIAFFRRRGWLSFGPRRRRDGRRGPRDTR